MTAMATMLEIYFAPRFLDQKANLLITSLEVSGWHVDQKKLNLF